MKLFTLIITLIFATSCNQQDDQNSGDKFCYSFDVRGCQTDQYSESVNVVESKEIRESTMISWLEDQDIKTIELDLLVQFYDAYCEACYVCTNGDKYIITTDSPITEERAEDLELFNFQTLSCE